MAIKASAQITISKVIDIYACYRYYKLQSSTLAKPSKPTTNPPSGWSDTEPAYVSGSTNTLYFVDCNVYSDKSFSFSEVSKSSSYEAAKDAWNKANNAQNSVDKMEIGGRNLKQNSNFSKGITSWGYEGTINFNSITDSTYGYCGQAAFTSSYANERIYTSDYNNRYNLTNNVYAVSFVAKASAAVKLTVYRAGTAQTIGTVSLSTSWQRFTMVYTASGTGSITFKLQSAGTLYITNVKIERGNKATDWTPAPEDSIAKVDVEYYLSTSATSLSGGSWSTTAPTWVNGKYMWSRTVTVDGAGNKTYSPNQNGVCIAGAKGDKGDTGATGQTGPQGPQGGTGATGKGISSIVEQYYKSTSSVELSGGSWSNTYPGWENGKYIWTRSVITYTDKTSTTTTPVCVTGTKGDTGAKGDKGETGPAGKGISSTAVTYQASTSGTSIPTGTWATSIPAVAAGSYLWTRTIITYTDKTSTTSYAVGKMGNTGATGKGIKSTSITYQAHSNGTTAPTGTWTELVPTTSAEKPYLWSRTILTYTDNTTSTTYSVGSAPDGVLDEIKKVLRYDDTKITLGRTGSNITLNLQNTDMVITDGEVDLMSIGVRTKEIDGTTWTVTSLYSDRILSLGGVNEMSLSSRILQLESFEGGIRFDVKSYQGNGQPIQFYKGVDFSQGWTQNIPTLDYGNCNEITESGYYYIGSKGTNRPENTNGWLECMKYSTNYCAQTYTTITGKRYTRYQQNGTWGAWFRVWQSRQLFGNESQAMNTSITLSDSAANYDMLEIFYKSNDAPQNSVRVYSPNGKKVDLTSTTYVTGSYNYLFIKAKQVQINGTTINTFTNNYGYCTGEMEIRNGNTTIGKYVDNVGIIRVLGWR